MVDVFISYARANRDTVCRLAEAIGRLGYVVWWDEELPAHLSYGEVITQKIGEAKATLVVWSAESAASEWVRAEADMARNQKCLIQASIDQCMPPMPFNQIQFAAIGDWTGAEDHPGWRKVRASLAALCGPAPADTVAPLAAPVTAAPVIAVPAPAENLAEGWALAAPKPPVVRSAPKRSANRVALVAIAGSAMAILTVGGLVLLKGPPAAQAGSASAAARPAPAPASAQSAAPILTPPKNGSVDVQVGAGSVSDGVESETAGDTLDASDDF